MKRWIGICYSLLFIVLLASSAAGATSLDGSPSAGGCGLLADHIGDAWALAAWTIPALAVIPLRRRR